MKKLITLLILFAASHIFVLGQINPNWFGGVGEANTVNKSVKKVLTDSEGSVIMVGWYQGAISFYGFPAGATRNAFIIKYDVNGNLLWSKAINNAECGFNGFDIDHNDNIILTGFFFGTIDLNPGAGVTNVTATGSYDAFLLKLNKNGEFVWGRKAGSTGGDSGNDVAVDANGFIYMTGFHSNSCVFSISGESPNTIGSVGATDCFISKFSPSGSLIYAYNYGGSNGEDAYSIGVTSDKRIYIGGYFFGPTDFYPGSQAGTINGVQAGGRDGYILVLDSNAVYLSVQIIGSGDNFNPNAATTFDEVKRLHIDENDNVYVTGYFQGFGNFPAGNFNSVGGTDAFIWKANAPQWVKRIGGTGNDEGLGISFVNNNILVTGYFTGTVNLNPNGTPTSNFTSAGQTDAFVIGLKSNGDFGFAYSTGGPNADVGTDIHGNVGNSKYYSVGQIKGIPGSGGNTSVDLNPTAAVLNYSVGPINTTHLYIQAFDLCDKLAPITGASGFCSGSSYTLNVAPFAGATGYTWNLPNGWTGSSTTNSINITAGSNTGLISVTANGLISYCGDSLRSTINATFGKDLKQNLQHYFTANKNKNHKSIVGSDSIIPTGIFNYAADRFNNDSAAYQISSKTGQFFTVPTFSQGSGVGATYSVWYQYGGSGGTNSVIFGAGANGLAPLVLALPSGMVHACNSAGATVGSGFQLVDGQWYHIALARNGSNFSFFVNGNLIDSGNNLAPGNFIRLGAHNPNVPSQGALGKFDEIRIYNQMLDAESILLLSQMPAYISSISENPIIGCLNSNVNVSSNFSGTGVTYEWKRNGQIVGSNSLNYNLNNITSNDSLLSLTIKNNCAFETYSSTIQLNVPSVSIMGNDSVCSGQSIDLTVVGADNVVWQNGLGSNATISVSPTSTTTYTANGSSNGCAFQISKTIYIKPIPLTITSQPQSQAVCQGSSFSLSVATSGVTPSNYVWKRNGMELLFNNSNTLTVSNSDPASHTASYVVEISVAGCGIVTSNAANVVVNPLTTITTQPTALTQCVGTNASFTVVGAGAGTLTYQWKKGTNNISGATNATLNLSNISAADAANYSVDVTGTCGTATSNAVALTVNPATSVATQPSNSSTCIGGNASFTVVAAGTGPFTYQWKKGSNNISGALSATLNITNTTAGDAGNYSVEITGTCGTVTSNVATLLVNTSTVINTQPTSLTQCAGTNASFTVAASGAGTLTYAWKKGTNIIFGAAAATLNLTNITAAEAGDYSVEVTSGCGTTTSNVATLTVNPLTSISTQPTAATQCVGANASFTVAAAGTGTLTYQWKKGSNNITGANSATLNLSNITATEAANYSVDVTGTCGTVASNAVALTVNPLTTITTQPTALTQCAGTNASFTVVGAGAGTLTYQWKKGSNNITGATTATLNLNNITAADAANYSVDVTGTCGTVTSNVVALAVNPITTISTQPIAVIQCAGTNASFTVAADGTGTLTYQWKKGSNNITGANSATLNLTNITAADAANYSVVVTGTCGNVTSNVVALTVNPLTTITTQPTALTQCAGTNTSFTVVGAGAGTLTYQWKKGTNNITGATTATLNLTNITVADAANYSVDVTGTCGTVTSNVVALAVNPITTISTQPIAVTQCAGTNASFTVVAAGTSTLTYQWKKGANNITGATTATLNLNNITAADAANYSVVVTGTCGNVTSTAVALTVNPLTTITTQPTALTQCQGTNATFSVVAAGTGTLSYQWKKAGANIVGATNASYTINNIGASDVASYTVEITGTCGSVTSNAAALALNTPVSITTQPIGGTICEGAPGLISVSANGSGTLTYQWLFNSLPIPGATSNTLANPAMILANAGDYSVSITGTCGTVTSNIVSVIVNPATVIQTQPIPTTLCEGENLMLISDANGTSPITLQWQLNGQNISGADNDTLMLSAVTGNDIGNYSLIATGTCGVDTSDLAMVMVNPIFNETASAAICQGDVYNLGTQTLTTAGTFTEVFQTVNGCDSIVVLTLNVNPTFNQTASASICDGDVYTFGTQTLTTAGTFTEIFQTVNGCDSTVVLSLAVTTINTTINEVDFVLNAVSQTGATYQWIDCNNNNTPIAGETNNVFSPSTDGSYAVIINLNNCSDTSSCFTILGIGITEKELVKFNIYPNPARNQFSIENAEIGSTVQINDLFGKTIFVGKIYDVKTTIEADRFNNGVYSIMIENNGKVGIQKLIISK